MQEAPQTVGIEDTGGDRCPFCHCRVFKRSRLHMSDVFTLLRFRVPARCGRCGQLQTISFKTAKGALPAGSENETAQPLSDVALQEAAARKGLSPLADSRASIPHGVLHDALDLRCQYCPGQAFRRSRLRAKDVVLILRMRYSARCMRCGQRQTVNFMVAGSAVASSVKQARSLKDSESWQAFTANSAPDLAPTTLTKPLKPFIAQVYTLKDAPLEETVSLPRPVRPMRPVVEEAPAETAPAPAKAGPKRPVDDQSIW